MTKLVHLHFVYEKWVLKEWQDNPSGRPGWESVLNFVRTLIKLQIPSYCWILEWNSRLKYYKNTLAFSIKAENESYVLDSLSVAMRTDAISLIKVQRVAPLGLLLKDYSMSSEGVITNNQKSAVFYQIVEASKWTMLGNDEMIVVVNHDGDPIFFLTLPTVTMTL